MFCWQYVRHWLLDWPYWSQAVSKAFRRRPPALALELAGGARAGVGGMEAGGETAEDFIQFGVSVTVLLSEVELNAAHIHLERRQGQARVGRLTTACLPVALARGY